MRNDLHHQDPIVITGIGLVTSVGDNRETAWRSLCDGQSGVRKLQEIYGLPKEFQIGATTEMELFAPGAVKIIRMCERAAAEAWEDAKLEEGQFDPRRFGCAISSHMGDPTFMRERFGVKSQSKEPMPPWWHQWLPNSACSFIANQHGLLGPRLCHSTACASSMMDILAAVRGIQDGQCDIALAGGGEAIDPLMAAGFHRMRVLAAHEDPVQACRPFDRDRNGFVMGEGASMMIFERLSHARSRGANIYAEFLGGTMHAEAHHVTGLGESGETLAHAIQETLRKSGITARDIGYINAHGTGTQQNDIVESKAIHQALGKSAMDTCVSSTKSMLGHLVNAAGGVETAVTALALRDGHLPPTLNLVSPDPACDLDCVPLVARKRNVEFALKLSVAFGGHLVAIALRRWPREQNGVKTGGELRVA